MTGLKKIAGAYIAMVTLFAAAGAAIAAEPMIVEASLPRAVVSYADLDLSNSAGDAALRGRIKKAASSLCVQRGALQLPQMMQQRRCYAAALASAETQVSQAIAQSDTRLAARRNVELALGK